jgi:hypothetical protein
MNQPTQSSTGSVAGLRPDIPEKLLCEQACDTATLSIIEDWIDEADHFYTTAPAAALGFGPVGSLLTW